MKATTTSTSRRSRRLVAASAIAAFALVAAACGGSDEAADEPAAEPAETAAAAEEPTPAETTAEEPAAEPFQVGLVAPSAANDLAWTQSMSDSLDRVADGRPLEIKITDGTFVVEDAAAAIRGYAEDGFDLVIAHGTQFGGPLQEIADDFPEVSFALGTSTDFFGKANIFAYAVDAGEGGFVNGVMAAQLTQSKVIGVVGPVPAGDAKQYIDGFVSGVAAQDPGVDVNVNYIDSFGDVQLASEAAKAHVSNGADVLTGTAQMVVGATGVAAEEGIPWFGTQSNQTGLGADIVVASQVYHWEVALNQIIDKVQSGTLGGEGFVLSFDNGGLEMEYNDGFSLEDAVRTSADSTVAGISDGSIVVPVSE